MDSKMDDILEFSELVNLFINHYGIFNMNESKIRIAIASARPQILLIDEVLE